MGLKICVITSGIKKYKLIIKKTKKNQDKTVLFYYQALNWTNVCNRCHDLLMVSINLSDVAILNIKGCDYRYIISGISKSEAKLIAKYWLGWKKQKIAKKIKNYKFEK